MGYTAGQSFEATVVLDADHNGEAQWQFCPHSQEETEECFRENPVSDWVDVHAYWDSSNQEDHWKSGEHFSQTVTLPSGVPAGPGTLRWLWVCKYTDEVFVSCIDIDVVSGAPTPEPVPTPVPSGTLPTPAPQPTRAPTVAETAVPSTAPTGAPSDDVPCVKACAAVPGVQSPECNGKSREVCERMMTNEGKCQWGCETSTSTEETSCVKTCSAIQGQQTPECDGKPADVCNRMIENENKCQL